MNKEDVTKRLCKLSTIVGERAFGNLKAHDCFCVDAVNNENFLDRFQFEDDVLRFIEVAVNERLEKLERDRRAREND